MQQRLSLTLVTLAAAVAVAGGCTIKKQAPPPLAGPSEFGTSVVVSIAPDVLPQDGASQSLVTITVRDANSQPVRNLSLRAELRVNGVPTDFGSLSARNVVTGADGRATLVYTAPAAPAGPSADAFTFVEISVTPIGTDANSAWSRAASVRLVPPSVVIPPDLLRPAFTMAPSTPADNQAVLFDASTSASAPNNPIATYAWDFGDGATGTGRTASHAYRVAGTYIVTLTIGDQYGRAASASQTLTVSAAVGPTAVIAFSPADPRPNDPVNFIGSASVAAPGHRVVSYAWDFGDGTSGTGEKVSHAYALERTYTVVLVVTDETGKRGTANVSVTVKMPSAPKATGLAAR